MEQPYARYLERLIHNINTRDDILDTASIRQRLNVKYPQIILFPTFLLISLHAIDSLVEPLSQDHT